MGVWANRKKAEPQETLRLTFLVSQTNDPELHAWIRSLDYRQLSASIRAILRFYLGIDDDPGLNLTYNSPAARAAIQSRRAMSATPAAGQPFVAPAVATRGLSREAAARLPQPGNVPKESLSGERSEVPLAGAGFERNGGIGQIQPDALNTTPEAQPAQPADSGLSSKTQAGIASVAALVEQFNGDDD
jgi:hypothetical protein